MPSNTHSSTGSRRTRTRKRKRALAEDTSCPPSAASSTNVPPLTSPQCETVSSSLSDTTIQNPPKLGSSFSETSEATQSSSFESLWSHEQEGSSAEPCEYFHQSPNFLPQYILGHAGCHGEGEGEADCDCLADAVNVLHVLATSPSSGITKHSGGTFSCTPPSLSNLVFQKYFVELANAIAAVPVAPRNTTHFHADTARNTEAAQSPMVWHTPMESHVIGPRNKSGRPSFLLSASNPSIIPSQHSDNDSCSLPQWSNVLIVGDHRYGESSEKSSFGRLAFYAEQVFIAQPFRTFVFGIYTSDGHSTITFCKIDRAGILRSNAVDFSSTAGNGRLLDVVMCLRRFMRMQPQAMGFQSMAVADGGMMPFATADGSGITLGPLRRHPNTPNNNYHSTPLTVCLEKLTFCASGLVGRGSRVWKGSLGSHENNIGDVAIKLTWRGICGESEDSLYKLAQSRKVFGLPTLIAVETYEEIHADVRHGHAAPLAVDFTRTAPAPPPDQSASPYTITTREYTTWMASRDRKLTLLVFSPFGVPTTCSSLSPLSIARALLAACIGHASLYFDGGILHRDISPSNILACDPPVPIPRWARREIVGISTSLAGCLIDLDHAIDITKSQGSGTAGRTGTWPFISIGVLNGQEHRYRHDLESFFYVFLWLSCYPVSRRAETDHDPTSPFPRNHPLYRWGLSNGLDVATHKQSCIVSNRQHFEILLSRFRPKGFKTIPWVQAAWKFRSILWGVKGSKGCMVPDVIARPIKEPRGSTTNNTEVAQGAEESDPAEIYPDQVRSGVSEFQAFIELRTLLEDLVVEISELDIE